MASLVAAWTALLTLAAWNEDRQAHATAIKLATTEAASSFQKDIVYRKWAAAHGGVYVPVTKDLQPSPWLADIPERDVVTPSGRTLTLVNPARMTRQVHELGQREYGSRGHITSLHPLRADNKADAWETRALRAFEAGRAEQVEVVTEDGAPYLRFMRPLRTEKSCLKCHAKQGYKEGDISGGISVRVAFTPFHEAAMMRRTNIETSYGAVWLLGIGGLAFTRRRARRADQLRRQTEATRARLEGQLAQSQKLETIGRLAGGVAHDFNNMLTVIRGHAEVALDQVDLKDPLHADLLEILRASDRSSQLTRQLLAFARKQAVSPRVVDLNDSIAGMLRMLQRLIGESIRLVWMPSEVPLAIRVDPSQLDQILINLCLNARDAIRDVGRLTLGTNARVVSAEEAANDAERQVGEFVELTVSDDGVGMDAETVSHLFEPFFTTKARGRGTGLGLATVYGIVKQNGGWLAVESTPGVGSTFRVFLPRLAELPEDAAATEEAVSAPRGSGTVLVVEDEAAILSTISRMLTREGYTALLAPTPREALRIAAQRGGEIDVVLTDVVMPDMNGAELAEALRLHLPTVPVVFMSGYTADVIGHHGVLADGVLFLQKPFSRQDLTSKVREAMARAEPS